MTIRRLLGLFLLLWMVIKRANGEETISSFIRDIMTTFKLNSPTIIYDSDEAPDICFTDQWVLCLSSQDTSGVGRSKRHRLAHIAQMAQMPKQMAQMSSTWHRWHT